MTRFIRHSIQTLEKFIQEMDRHLHRTVEAKLIGGGAAALGYQTGTGTRDLDFASGKAALQKAHNAAQKATGIDIPMEQVGILDAPYHYEDRLVEVTRLKLSKLRIFVPEKHDYALIKMVCGVEHDVETIEALHEKYPLDLQTLIHRWNNEMNHITGNLTSIRRNVLNLIERLFGEEEAENAENRLEKHG